MIDPGGNSVQCVGALILLHKQATITSTIRAAIKANGVPAWMVTERYGICETTVRKRRNRYSMHHSQDPHRLQTTLTPAQEAVAVVLRQAPLLLPTTFSRWCANS